MDLGIKSEAPEVTSPSPAPTPSYPSLSLRDEQVDRVKEEHDCQVGGEYTATVRLRVTRVAEGNHEKSLGFDVIEMDDLAPAETEAEVEDEKEYEDSKGKRVPKGVAKAMDRMK